jgi:hypothetical protein
VEQAVSGRRRSAPWFRTPGARLDLAVDGYERARARAPAFFLDDSVVEDQLALRCEQCLRCDADVRERATETVDGVLYVNGVLRLRALLCDRCVRLLAQ